MQNDKINAFSEEEKIIGCEKWEKFVKKIKFFGTSTRIYSCNIFKLFLRCVFWHRLRNELNQFNKKYIFPILLFYYLFIYTQNFKRKCSRRDF